MENLAPFEYERDDAKRRIRVTARRALQPDEFRAIVDRQVQEQTWAYALLYDLRRMSEAVARSDADMLAAYVYRYLITHGSRGPVAVVTTSFGVLGAAQVYATNTSRAGVEVHVFWDVFEAERWLDAEQERQL
jgi:hypothetical protein